MKIRSFLMIFVLVSVMARTTHASLTPPGSIPVLPHAYKIAIVGDEHVNELGPLLVAKANAPDTWLSGAAIRFEAHPGGTAADWSTHGNWGAELRRWRPDTVVIVLGTNDGKTDRDPTSLLNDFQWLNDAFSLLTSDKGYPPTIIWANPPRLDGSPRLEEIREIVSRVKGANGNTYFFDPRRPWPVRENKLSLTPEGYRLWAKVLAKLL
jgi:lysophospholipase L1-like esterase